MVENVLVAYASKHGATAQIAERIALRLTKNGIPAVAQDVRQIASLQGFGAVLLGRAVYAGAWLKEAAEFLKKYEAELAKIPVWFFSDGPTGIGDPQKMMEGWDFPEDLKSISERIQPRGLAFFHGAIDTTKLKFAEKLIISAVKVPVGDFRDWDMINSWADSVSKALQ